MSSLTNTAGRANYTVSVTFISPELLSGFFFGPDHPSHWSPLAESCQWQRRSPSKPRHKQEESIYCCILRIFFFFGKDGRSEARHTEPARLQPSFSPATESANDAGALRLPSNRSDEPMKSIPGQSKPRSKDHVRVSAVFFPLFFALLKAEQRSTNIACPHIDSVTTDVISLRNRRVETGTVGCVPSVVYSMVHQQAPTALF